LEVLRAELNVEIENHRSLLSPIHRVPSEILQEIFTACLPAAHNPVLSGDQPPLLLTRVCQKWRDIMFSTPHLWSAIHILITSLPVGRRAAELPTDVLSTYFSHTIRSASPQFMTGWNDRKDHPFIYQYTSMHEYTSTKLLDPDGQIVCLAFDCDRVAAQAKEAGTGHGDGSPADLAPSHSRLAPPPLSGSPSSPKPWDQTDTPFTSHHPRLIQPPSLPPRELLLSRN
jgi:hypothetical protein